MGFFSDIVGGVGDFFSGGVGDVVGAGIDVLGNVVAANTASDAANRAGDVAQSTASENIAFSREQAEIARRLFEEARDEGLRDLDAGRLAALERIGVGVEAARRAYEGVLLASEGGIEGIRALAAMDPSQLTQAQRILLDDTLRNTTNRIDQSGLRGSGRAGQAVLADVEARARAGAEAENLARKDRAMEILANQGFGATRNLASLDASTGSDLARIELTDAGNKANVRQGFASDAAGVESDLTRSVTAAQNSGALGQINAIRDAGQVDAGAALANAQILGKTAGSLDPLRGIIASEDPSRQRPSRFAATS